MDGIVRTVPDGDDTGTVRRFDGIYGRGYSAVMRSRRGRRVAASLWGGASVIVELDRIAAAIAEALGSKRHTSTAEEPVLLDVPSGQGTMLPLLADAGYGGPVIELDLSLQLLARGRDGFGHSHGSQAAPRVAWVHGNALELPLRDACMDAAVSLNGLHVMPDPARFLAELARVLQPGGDLWLVTLVDASHRRTRALLALGRGLGIIPALPPSLPELVELVAAAGFEVVQWLGGSTFVGLHLRRTINRAPSAPGT